MICDSHLAGIGRSYWFWSCCKEQILNSNLRFSLWQCSFLEILPMATIFCLADVTCTRCCINCLCGRNFKFFNAEDDQWGCSVCWQLRMRECSIFNRKGNSTLQERSTTFIFNISCSHCSFKTKHYTRVILPETKGFLYANPLKITDIYLNKSSWTLTP